VTTAAPPLAEKNAASCNRVLEKLPVQLKGLAPRIVHTTPDTPYVVAWGNPPVVLACGVARPAALHPGSGADAFKIGPPNGPNFFVTSSGGDEVYTTVDRAVYIAISVPAKYHSGPVPPLAAAIARALPAVCSIQNGPPADLCTHRP
jgi:hypothetical protein